MCPDSQRRWRFFVAGFLMITVALYPAGALYLRINRVDEDISRMDGNTEKLIRELSAPLWEAKGWMRFLGVVAFLYGVLLALTIIGLIIAWLPIWIGVLLFQSANAADRAQYEADQESFIRSLAKLRLCFAVLGGLILLGILVLSIFLLAVIAGGVLGERIAA